MSKKCNHKANNFEYYPATNEDGWMCMSCFEKLGFRPDLDKEEIAQKVSGILNDLHEHDFIYVSNGTTGTVIIHNVSKRCVEEERYDQYFIIKSILEDSNVNWKSHSDFWKEKHIKNSQKGSEKIMENCKLIKNAKEDISWDSKLNAELCRGQCLKGGKFSDNCPHLLEKEKELKTNQIQISFPEEMLKLSKYTGFRKRLFSLLESYSLNAEITDSEGNKIILK